MKKDKKEKVNSLFEFMENKLIDLVEHNGLDYPNEFETERLILKKEYVKSHVHITYKLHLKDNNNCIGEIELYDDSEVRYKIYSNSHRKQGYMLEAMKKILEYFKEERLVLYIWNRNIDSTNLAKNLNLNLIASEGEMNIFSNQ